jgi:hypothetical protein
VSRAGALITQPISVEGEASMLRPVHGMTAPDATQ